MINLTANPNKGVDIHQPGVCLPSIAPLARSAYRVVRPIDGFQSADDVGLALGSAWKSALVSLRTNVHQNVHQRIKKDRIGYVRIRPYFYCKLLTISILHSDSDPLPRIPVDLIGYGRIVPD